MGGSPIKSAKRSASAERESPASLPRSFTVHWRAGSACISPGGDRGQVVLHAPRRLEGDLVQLYAGNAAPFNFNGLVRHHFLRRSPHLADLQFNLSPEHDRDAQSHALARPGVGRDLARIDAPASREAVPVRVRLSADDRASRERRLVLRVDSPTGGQVSIAELTCVDRVSEPQSLVRKDLKPVVYVMGEVAATFLSRLAVPVVYCPIARQGWTRRLGDGRALEFRGFDTLLGAGDGETASAA